MQRSGQPDGETAAQADARPRPDDQAPFTAEQLRWLEDRIAAGAARVFRELRHISQHQALRAAPAGSAALDLKRENPALANPSGPRRHQKETAAPWAEGTAADGVRAQEKTQREEYAEALIEASGLERVTNWNRARWDWKAAIMKDHRLSDGAKLVAVVLCDTFANSKTALCYPGVKTLAETLGKSERSIRRALAELREAGWIVTEAGRRPHDRQGFIFTKGDGTVLMDEKVADLCAHPFGRPQGEHHARTVVERRERFVDAPR